MLELIQHQFIQNALLAGTIVAVICGLVGYFVVLRGQAFATESLSHVGFTGATGAGLIGAGSLFGMFFLTLVAGFSIGTLGRRLRGRDVEIGMVLAVVLGLGVLFLNLFTSSSISAVNLLFGSILSVSWQDTLMTLAAGIVVLVVLASIFRPLLFSSIDPEVAEARGVPVRALSIIFTLLLAITVSVTVQVVGVLLVFALLVVPAATAEQLSYRPFTTLGLSLALSLGATWGGLVLSFIFNVPVSFCITGLTSVLYFAARGYHHLCSPRCYQDLPHPSRETEEW